MSRRKTLFEIFKSKDALYLPRRSRDPLLGKLYGLAKSITLKNVSRVQADFDPLYDYNSSFREVLFFIGSPKVLKTNETVTIRTKVFTDRREPMLLFTLDNGHRLKYFTSNLSSINILQHFNSYMEEYGKSAADGAQAK